MQVFSKNDILDITETLNIFQNYKRTPLPLLVEQERQTIERRKEFHLPPPRNKFFLIASHE